MSILAAKRLIMPANASILITVAVPTSKVRHAITDPTDLIITPQDGRVIRGVVYKVYQNILRHANRHLDTAKMRDEYRDTGVRVAWDGRKWHATQRPEQQSVYVGMRIKRDGEVGTITSTDQSNPGFRRAMYPVRWEDGRDGYVMIDSIDEVLPAAEPNDHFTRRFNRVG